MLPTVLYRENGADSGVQNHKHARYENKEVSDI
jgi:hypothetical protein